MRTLTITGPSSCESFADLAEIVGPIDSETLGAEADRQFFEIRLNNFGVPRTPNFPSDRHG
jgi:hypothetical protein